MAHRDFIQEKRQIRVFISSSFEDMDNERNYLRDVVFSRLQDKARQRAVAVTALDLRWGIPDGTDLGETIEICMNEIDNSFPFFIGIIGGHYGTTPDKTGVFDRNVILREQFSVLSKYFERELSITDMEMRYGVLDCDAAEKEKINALFLTREKDLGDINGNAKLSSLHKDIEKCGELFDKNKFTRDDKNHIWSANYSSVEEFGRIVEEVFGNILDRLFPEEENQDTYQRQRFMQQSIVADLSRFYIPNDSSITTINGFIESAYKQKLLITGESGSGKSSLLAYWISRYATEYHNQEYDIIYHFVGSGESECNSKDIENRILYEVFSGLGVEPKNDYEKSSLGTLLSRNYIRDSRKIVIILDAVNQLQSGQDLVWLHSKSLPSDVKLIISTLTGDQTEHILRNFKTDEDISVRGLTEEAERREAIGMYVKEFHGRDLGEANLEKVVKWPLAQNPLALKTLLNELIVAGKYDMMDTLVDGYVSCQSIESLFDRILLRTSSNPYFSWVGDALSAIALSRYGLSENELLRIFPIHILYWSSFYCSFQRHFFVRNGLMTFSHQYVRKAVDRSFLSNTDERKRIHSLLIRLFKDGRTAREQEELMHHYYAVGDFQAVYSLASNPVSFVNLWQNDENNIISFWEILLKKGYSPACLILTYDQWIELDSKYYEDNAIGFGDGYSAYCEHLQRLLSSLNLHDLSLKLFQVLEQHTENYGTYGLEHTRMYRIIAASFESIGELEKAIDLYKRSFWALEKLEVNTENGAGSVFVSGFNEQDEKDHLVDPMFSEVYISISSCYRRLGQYSAARKFLDYAKEAVDPYETDSSSQADYASYLLEEVRFCLDSGKYDDADTYLSATRLARTARYTDLAEIKYLYGDYSNAISVWHRYLETIMGDAQTSTGVDAAIAYREIAKSLIELDKPIIAERFIEASFRCVEGRNDADYLRAKNYEQLARIKYFRKDYSSSLEYYLEAAQTLERMKLWPEWLEVSESAANVYSWLKQTRKGTELLQNCLSTIEAEDCGTDYQKGMIHWTLAGLENCLGDYESCFEHARLAFLCIVEKLGPRRKLSVEIIKRLDACLEKFPSLLRKMNSFSDKTLSAWERYTLLSGEKGMSVELKTHLCCNAHVSDPVLWRIAISLLDNLDEKTTIRILGSSSVDEFLEKILSCIERDFDKGFLRDVFMTIILSPAGAEEHRLRSLSQTSRSGVWDSLCQQYGSMFQIQDGKVTFSCDSFKAVIISHYFKYDLNESPSILFFTEEMLRVCPNTLLFTRLDGKQYYRQLKQDAEDLKQFVTQSINTNPKDISPIRISNAIETVLKYCSSRDDVFMYLGVLNFEAIMSLRGVENELTQNAARCLHQCINYDAIQSVTRGHVCLTLGVQSYREKDYKSALSYLSDYYSLAYEIDPFNHQMRWYRIVKECLGRLDGAERNSLISKNLQHDWKWVSNKYKFIDNAILLYFNLDEIAEDKENNHISIVLSENPSCINSYDPSHDFRFERYVTESRLTMKGDTRVDLYCRRGLWKDLDEGSKVMNLYRINYSGGGQLKDFDTFIKAVFKIQIRTITERVLE